MYYHDPFTVVASFLPPAILVCLVVQLVLYLLGSAGLYAMANNTGMKNRLDSDCARPPVRLAGGPVQLFLPPEKIHAQRLAYRFKRNLSAAVGAVGSAHFDFAAAFL